MLNKVVFILALGMGLQTASAQQADEKVIYGEDGRQDLYAVTDDMQLRLADSTVVLMRKNAIQSNASGELSIRSSTFGQSMGMCRSERFYEQPNAGFCSGSLIGPNMILTAGHCIESESECSATAFVFGYAVKEEGKFPTKTNSEEVFFCSRVLHTQAVGGGADFALIQLDRPVAHHDPLPMAARTTQTEAAAGTKLIMIGHPAGLPTKVEATAKIRRSANGYFVANTDSYGGNSGSSVFNKETGEIEGVLVRGVTDYVRSPQGCRISNVCAEEGCNGEDVTKISSVLAKLRELSLQ